MIKNKYREKRNFIDFILLNKIMTINELKEHFRINIEGWDKLINYVIGGLEEE